MRSATCWSADPYAVPYVHLINIAKMAQFTPIFHKSSGDCCRRRLSSKRSSDIVAKVRCLSQTSEHRLKLLATFDVCERPATFGHKPSRVENDTRPSENGRQCLVDDHRTSLLVVVAVRSQLLGDYQETFKRGQRR